MYLYTGCANRTSSRVPKHTFHDGAVGQPRYDVPVSTLESLVCNAFTGPQIAEINIVSQCDRYADECALVVKSMHENTSAVETVRHAKLGDTPLLSSSPSASTATSSQ